MLNLTNNARYWANNNFQIQQVLSLRNSLLNSRFQSNVSDSRTSNKFIEIAKEIAISYKPVDIELELKNKINMNSSKIRYLHQMA